jgi:integrase
MKWDQVDFNADTIMVKSARKGAKYKYRLVPIHQEFRPVLKQWLDIDRGKGFIINYRGKQVRSLKKIFQKAKQEAGITRRLRLYDFRHAFVSLLLKNSADLKATSELAGHSRTETTTRIYQHTDFKMHQDAISRLPALPIGNPEKKVTKVITPKRWAGKGL